MITNETVDRARTLHRGRYWWVILVSSVLLAVLFASVFSPDMGTGSAHEHLPLVGFIDWIWAAVAIGYLAFVRRDRADMTLGISVTVLWLAVAVTSIAAPVFVTGTDPTQIPLAAMLAPVLGSIVTGFLALHATSRNDDVWRYEL
ncbi:MAG: hypothetical protein WBZ40_13420 [Acidimicrobiia bacterium]